MQQTACFIVNQITVNNIAALFNCAPAGRASDLLMASIKLVRAWWSVFVGPPGFKYCIPVAQAFQWWSCCWVFIVSVLNLDLYVCCFAFFHDCVYLQDGEMKQCLESPLSLWKWDIMDSANKNDSNESLRHRLIASYWGRANHTPKEGSKMSHWSVLLNFVRYSKSHKSSPYIVERP